MVLRPLPALTVEDLTAQLIWRVVGPLPWLRPRVHAALLWAGVSAQAPLISDIGASFDVSHEAVRKWLKPIRLAVPTVPLSEQQLQHLSQPSFPGDDHLARTRRAELFGLARPKTLRELITPRWSNWIRLAEQILAAVGPLTLRQLHAGISNARRRQHEQVPIDELGVAVLATGSIRFTGGGYDRAVGAAPLRRHADLVARARGHGAMTYTEAVQIMKASGWSATSARGSAIYYCPLLTPRQGRWMLIDRI